jgi:hypothetical protein
MPMKRNETRIARIPNGFASWGASGFIFLGLEPPKRSWLDQVVSFITPLRPILAPRNWLRSVKCHSRWIPHGRLGGRSSRENWLRSVKCIFSALPNNVSGHCAE